MQPELLQGKCGIFCCVFRDVVLLRIEEVIESVVSSLSSNVSPSIVVANTGVWNNVRYVT